MQIQIFSDTVCPWCRIGKAHLDQAIKQLDEPVSITWRTFILDPMVPQEGIDFMKKMSHLGNPEQLQQIFMQVEEAGKRVNLNFDFSKINISPNTTMSHQLIHIAPEDKKMSIATDLMSAYFENGADIGQMDVLLSIAQEHGLDATQVQAQIDRGEGKQQIAQDVAASQNFGIRAVPFFIIDQRVGVSGAQPPEVLLQAFQQAKEVAAKENSAESI